MAPAGLPRLPEVQGVPGGHRRGDVPEVYRSRLDPNRSALAGRAGASAASEQAVERALDWLMRHQDVDGRWDGATAKDDDGGVFRGDDDYTIHCPPGEPCFGECIYWEADTALTGLALLAYLGAGYTQTDGKYADTVGKGLDFLLAAQKPDGDLRGMSRAVGMYCHAMATLALCEAYALTGDERLRVPVERAVGFIVRSRARDGMAWRYAPGAPVGDTSILGWVVLALKSAKLVGISTAATTERGTLDWLEQGLLRPRGGPRQLPALGAGDADDDGRGLGLPPVPRRRRARAGEHRGRPVAARERAGPRHVQPVLLVLRHAGHVPARRRRLVALECRRSATRSSAVRGSRATRRAAGTPTTACTGPAGAGSTAPPWRP